jgi:hypothetical protein
MLVFAILLVPHMGDMVRAWEPAASSPGREAQLGVATTWSSHVASNRYGA